MAALRQIMRPPGTTCLASVLASFLAAPTSSQSTWSIRITCRAASFYGVGGVSKQGFWHEQFASVTIGGIALPENVLHLRGYRD